ALQLAEAASQLGMNRLWERALVSRTHENEIRSALTTYRRTGQAEGDWPEAMLETLARLRKNKLEEAIRNMAIGWTFYQLGATFAFTVDDLHTSTGVDRETIAAFCDFFSLEFGRANPEMSMPQVTHLLQSNPMLRHGDRYLCPVPNLLYWSMRPALEAGLRR